MYSSISSVLIFLVGMNCVYCGQFVDFKRIVDKINDLRSCDVYAADGLMSSDHDFIKMDDIENGLNKSENSLDFEFSVFGTKEASVYFSPDPIGGFGARYGYGILIDEKTSNEGNSILVIRKYEPKTRNVDLKNVREPSILFIGEIFKINIKFNYNQSKVNICVYVDDSMIECQDDYSPILKLAYVTFFSELNVINYNFYNCSTGNISLSLSSTAIEQSGLWLPGIWFYFSVFIIGLVVGFILAKFLHRYRTSKTPPQLLSELNGIEFSTQCYN